MAIFDQKAPIKSLDREVAPGVPTPVTPAPAPIEMRDFLDIDKQRSNIFDNVHKSLSTKFPVENDNYRLELSDIRYEKNKPYSLKEQKDAIMNRQTLDWPIRANWRLIDKSTNHPISEARKTITRVPYLTNRGTYIFRGNEYVLSNQARLRSGVYTREKENGELEAHVNLMPGTGSSFRIFMEPSTGIFKFKLGQGSVPAYPVLKALGTTDDQMKAAWGDQIASVNATKSRDFDLSKVYDKLASPRIRKQFIDAGAGLRATFSQMALDPEVSNRTLGKPYTAVNSEALVRTMQKLLHINQGKEEQDDRDNQANMQLYGPEDLFAERISKDSGNLSRQLLWKLTHTKDVNKIPAGYLSKQIYSTLLHSGIASPISEINTLEILDQLSRVTRMGEGALTSQDSVPDEARSVQPSQLGLIDVIRAPESVSIGVDSRLAINTLKGSDGKIYRKVLDRNGKERVVSSHDLINGIYAFPGEMQKEGTKARALVNGKIRYVDKKSVDHVLPSGSDMFSFLGNMVPGMSGVKGGRMAMGSRMITQALPLNNPEAPLVQSAMPNDPSKSFEELATKYSGNVEAKEAGRITGISPDAIDVVYGNGKKDSIELYNNFPFNQKSFIHNTPMLKIGDVFNKGDLLARSNYTDKTGKAVSLGTNLRVVYLPYKGNYEDAITISEGAAKKLSSEHMYLTKVPHSEGTITGKKEFISNFPGQFSKAQLDNIDDSGIVKPGTVLHEGDPIVIGVRQKEPTKGNALLRQTRSWNMPHLETWDHADPGLVTDAITSTDGIKVAVKAYQPMSLADKMADRFGSKGLVGRIVPDDQMPKDANGNPFEVIFNPLSIISRVNPTKLVETLLAKVARKTGKTYKLPAFMDDSMADWALEEARKAGVSEKENVFDAVSNKELKDIFTGEQFFMKLHHTAESKLSVRDAGAYTLDETPAKGSFGQAKRVGTMEISALLSHNVPSVLKDLKLVRGQKNDDFWKAYKQGLPTPKPGQTFVYDKFLNMLRAGGVRVNSSDNGNKLNVLAMRDQDVDALAGTNELLNGDAINIKDGSPVKGGLFDVSITGGRENRKQWAKITLNDPVPNPLMEEPIRRLLDLTEPKFMDLLKSSSGPQKILDKLKAINVNQELDKQYGILKDNKLSKRDNAVKIIQYLETAKKNKVHPSEWMITKVPVLPPAFRPVTAMDGIELTSDANLLYKELFEANKNYGEVKKDLDEIGPEREALYNSVKAVMGLGDPINVKNREKNVGGMLQHIFGKSSPKFGMFQQKLMSTTVDSVSRGSMIPDANLNMDEIGMPENIAWDLYRPYIMRRLSRKYNSGDHSVPMTDLAKWVINRDPRAKKAMEEEMAERPVIYSRAPTWHKFSVLAAYPKLIKGNGFTSSAVNSPGFTLDHDGDNMNFHVPATQEAVDEAKEKMLPSKNLLSTNDFKVHLLPRQEYLMGLYLATQEAKKKEPRRFATSKDAMQAVMRGELGMTDPVVIVG